MLVLSFSYMSLNFNFEHLEHLEHFRTLQILGHTSAVEGREDVVSGEGAKAGKEGKGACGGEGAVGGEK